MSKLLYSRLCKFAYAIDGANLEDPARVPAVLCEMRLPRARSAEMQIHRSALMVSRSMLQARTRLIEEAEGRPLGA